MNFKSKNFSLFTIALTFFTMSIFISAQQTENNTAQPDKMEILKLIGSIKTTDFPTRITEPITSITSLDSFNNRLDSGGILILENVTLYIGDVNLNQDVYFSIGVAKLKLINSKIFTNGNTFEIFCKELETDDTSFITAFESPSAKNGNNGVEQSRNGTDGEDGDNGGIVRISLTDKIIGNITVRLDGQSGGLGGSGYNGANGVNGSRGRGARNGSFGTCMRGAGNGGNGTNGQDGGNAGNGGQGGSGGTLFINYIEKDPQNNLSIRFKSKTGIGGNEGNIGQGGSGGKGGQRGSDAGNCGIGGRNGKDGNNGENGVKGFSGKTGQDGKSVIQRVNLNEMKFATEMY